MREDSSEDTHIGVKQREEVSTATLLVNVFILHCLQAGNYSHTMAKQTTCFSSAAAMPVRFKRSHIQEADLTPPGNV